MSLNTGDYDSIRTLLEVDMSNDDKSNHDLLSAARELL